MSLPNQIIASDATHVISFDINTGRILWKKQISHANFSVSVPSDNTPIVAIQETPSTVDSANANKNMKISDSKPASHANNTLILINAKNGEEIYEIKIPYYSDARESMFI